MRWHWTRQWRAPGVVTRGTRRPWLESLEERGSPSVLPFHGLPEPPLERPALAARNMGEEPWGPTTAPGDDWGPVVKADVGAENHPLTPTREPALIEFTGFQGGELLQTILQGGPSTTAERVPGIVDFYAQEGEDGLWTFSGLVVTDSPGGLLVIFGGLPTLVGQTTEVNEDGTFSLTIQLGDCEGGLATAQTTDWDGLLSNVAEDYVHRTSCAQ